MSRFRCSLRPGSVRWTMRRGALAVLTRPCLAGPNVFLRLQEPGPPVPGIATSSNLRQTGFRWCATPCAAAPQQRGLASAGPRRARSSKRRAVVNPGARAGHGATSVLYCRPRWKTDDPEERLPERSTQPLADRLGAVCGGAGPIRWNPGWKTFTAGSATARPWAASGELRATLGEAEENCRWTSFFRNPDDVSPLRRVPVDWPRCGGVSVLAWTRHPSPSAHA